jgi:GMP synthase (glutamine-hydrolysing)
VIEAPDGAEIIGRAEGCDIAAMRIGERIYTVQPHPEYGATFMQGLLDHRAPGVVPDPLSDHARGLLSTPTDNAAMATRIANVFRKGA